MLGKSVHSSSATTPEIEKVLHNINNLILQWVKHFPISIKLLKEDFEKRYAQGANLENEFSPNIILFIKSMLNDEVEELNLLPLEEINTLFIDNIRQLRKIIQTDTNKTNYFNPINFTCGSFFLMLTHIIIARTKENSLVSAKILHQWLRLFDELFSQIRPEHITMLRLLSSDLAEFLDLAETKYLLIFSILVIFHLFKEKPNNIDLFMAEQYLNGCRISSTTPSNQKKLYYCAKAKYFYEKRQIVQFEETLKEALKLNMFIPHLLDMIRLAGDLFKEEAPSKAIYYYQKYLECVRSDPKHLEAEQDHIPLVEQAIQSLETRIKEQEARVKQNIEDHQTRLWQLRLELASVYPMYKFKPKLENCSLQGGKFSVHIYLPLDVLPKCIDTLMKQKFPHITIVKIHNEKAYTGISFRTTEVNLEKIKNGLSLFISAFTQQETPLESNPLDIQPEPIVPSTKPAIQSPCELKAQQSTSSDAQEKEISHKLEKLSTKKVKLKKHKTAPTVTPVPLQISSVRKELNTTEFGFNEYPSAAMTPIYSTKEAQQKRQPRIFVTLKNVKGIQNNVLKKLKSLLNPYQEGVVAIGPRSHNQAGVKLREFPDSDNWRHCLIRFKIMGRFGNVRVVANPEEVIIKKDEITKREENYYLFSLGTIKNK